MAETAPSRCAWADTTPLLREYHDNEWGAPLHDDRGLFEFVVLEGAQAGLSWDTILKKRENYRVAFDGFDPVVISRYGDRDVQRLLADPGIVRNRLKVAATIGNARSFLGVQQEFGSFDEYIWRFVGGQPVKNGFGSPVGNTGADRRVGCDERGAAKAGVQVRRLHYLLRLHAGSGNGERPHRRLFPVRRGVDAAEVASPSSSTRSFPLP